MSSPMRIATVRDLGFYIRDRRQQLGITQGELASSAGVSRRWLLALEAGKPTVELRLVLRTMDALGLMLEARSGATGRDDSGLDDLIRRHGRDTE